MKKPTTYQNQRSEKKGLGNPIAIASFGLTALSAKDQVYSFIKNYWPWMLGLTGLSVGGYFIYKQIKDPNISLKTDTKKQPSSLSSLEAQNIAESLFKAMNSPGTDEELILDLLNGRTYNDFVKISDSFGKRYYDKILGSEGGWLLNDKFGLFEWLSFELTNKDMAKLQKVIPAIFKIEKTIRPGGKAIAKKTFTAHKAKKIEGVWHRKEIDKTYNKGEVLGSIIVIITDPWETNKKYAIIDKPWSLDELFIDFENIEA